MQFLKNKKNLLGFSGGVDSTALFFKLLENNIDFDIAIINYNQRKEALKEIEYAKKLAKLYNKKIFISEFKQKKFSEKIARDFRYNFFEEIILKNSYEVLLTAHQLNDKCEWFLMQFCKGAGTKELFGMDKIEFRKNYVIYRPLLKYSKKDLIEFLEKNNIKYFIDKTNFDTKFKRNYFRKNFCDKLIKEFKNGIKKSFEFLKNDIEIFKNLYEIKKIKDLFIIKFKIDNENLKIKAIDEVLKKEFSLLISYKTKLEILQKKDLVISHKIAIGFWKNLVFIAKVKKTTLPRKFKEFCRINKFPKNIRVNLYFLNSDFYMF